MLSSRSIFRLKFQALHCTISCARSNLSRYFQKCEFSHDLSCELKMERKGRQGVVDGKKQKAVMQVWRAVSTQPRCCEDDDDQVTLQSRRGEVYNTISENANSQVSNEPVDPISCPTAENSDGTSLDGILITPETHSLSMEIGSSLMRFIKGKGGCTQDEIEQEAQVKIIFPSSKKDDSIIIEGKSAECVTVASQKIQSIIDKAVNSREFDYSHFVSLPLAIHPGLVDKLFNFQNQILGVEASDNADKEEKDQRSLKAFKVSNELNADKVAPDVKAEGSNTPVNLNTTSIPLVSYRPKESSASVSELSSKLKDSGIEKFIFIKPKTFHLTVLMLKLWNKERVNTAVEVLQGVSSKVVDALENRPVSIRLKGLECMRGSLAKACVVYAPVEEIGGEGRLMRACQVIVDAFVKAGLVMQKDAEQNLKLHATIMNARHRKRKKRTRKVNSFDAREIFERYGSEEWGEYAIQEAHLSQRFAFDENGYYHCCASIPFPSTMQVD